MVRPILSFAFLARGSKEDLLLAVVHELNQELMHGVSAAMAEAGDNPLAQVVASIESIRRMFSERPEFYRLFFDLATLSFNNEALRPEVAKLYRELTDATNEMLGRVCAGMPTPLPIPQQDFAAVILAALDGVMLRTLVDQAYDPEALYRALAFMLISSASCSYYIAGEAPPLVEQIASYFLPAAGSTAGSEKKSEAG